MPKKEKGSTPAKSQGVPSPQESEASDQEDELHRLKVQQQDNTKGIQSLLQQQDENGDCIRELLRRSDTAEEKLAATNAKLDEFIDMMRRKSTTPSRASSPVPPQVEPITPKREISVEPVYIERATAKYIRDKQPVFNGLEFQEDTSSIKEAYVCLY